MPKKKVFSLKKYVEWSMECDGLTDDDSKLSIISPSWTEEVEDDE